MASSSFARSRGGESRILPSGPTRLVYWLWVLALLLSLVTTGGVVEEEGGPPTRRMNLWVKLLIYFLSHFPRIFRDVRSMRAGRIAICAFPFPLPYILI
jgi:hypothetical protein